MAYREDDDAALRRRAQLAREIASGVADAGAEREIAAIDAARIDAARVRLPQVARARIASPCQEKWDTMLGDGAVRSCSRCEKEVFDLSQMTLGRAEALIASKSGLCVRLYQRADGTMMFADCVVGAHGVVKRHLAITSAAIAIGGAALAWASQPPAMAQGATPTASSREARAAAEQFLHAGSPHDPVSPESGFFQGLVFEGDLRADGALGDLLRGSEPRIAPPAYVRGTARVRCAAGRVPHAPRRAAPATARRLLISAGVAPQSGPTHCQGVARIRSGSPRNSKCIVSCSWSWPSQ